MKKHTNKKIIQIIPATGWQAVYKGEGEPGFFDLACWALVEDGEYTYVEGLCGSDYLDFVESHRNFLGYKSPNDDIDWTIRKERF